MALPRPRASRSPMIAEAAEAFQPAPVEAPPTPKGDQAEGVRLVGQILSAATNARWPTYLRNFKHLLRAVEGGFDERLRVHGAARSAASKPARGLVRLERGRRGGLRMREA